MHSVFYEKSEQLNDVFLKNELNRIERRLVVDFFVNPSSRTQTRVEMFESLTKRIMKEIISLI